ncbi:phosphoribosylglycinamide formyltransferase [Sulfurospirillum sp. 1612]|uniref:phosphoribosylglycinamide formyltransferase n=1 Tax=Sulfurospirillum sp. 1612 TaxID=3094835 RepID=UPI002F9408B8
MLVKKIAILFSGTGSNLENLLEKLHQKEFDGFRIEVVLTLCNKPGALGIEKSRKFGIEPVLLDHTKFPDREAFDRRLVQEIQNSGAELCVLAGFMRFLTPYFTQNIKAINLHPSLLPLFKGGHAIEESYASAMKVGGISVHYVSEELDGGEIIAQKCFEKKADMSLESFENCIHQLEHDLLPEVIVDILSKK